MDPSTTLPLTVTLAVLAAAVTHAAWNAIAHGIKDQTLAFALIGVGGIMTAIPLVIVTALPRSSSWPYLLGSVAIHVFYVLLLMQCYRLGEFSQVYPLSRGVSPLVVTILAAVFVHEHLAFYQLAGVVVVSAGLAFLVFAGRRPGRGAFLAAVGTGLTIAAYTTVDGVGVRLSESPVGYIGWLILLQSLCVPMYPTGLADSRTPTPSTVVYAAMVSPVPTAARNAPRPGLRPANTRKASPAEMMITPPIWGSARCSCTKTAARIVTTSGETPRASG